MSAPSRPRSSRSRTRRPAAISSTPAPAVEPVALPAESTPSFAELGLPAVLVAELAHRGLIDPFPIQAAALPDALVGADVLGRASTGSGKTMAFGLAMLVRLAGRTARPHHPRGLVLVPTRELAMQVADALEPYARALQLSVHSMVGGTSFTRQTEALRRGIDVLVATPGRLNDHLRNGTCRLSEVETTTLDEADQMADMGFLPQVRVILDLVPFDGQRLLFSATLDREVDALIRTYLTDPLIHSVAPATASVATMAHHLLLITAADKTPVVASLGAREGRTLMFVRTKHGADRLAKQLRRIGVTAGALHGGKAQNARTRILAQFRDGTVPVLVATDVAARGIHVADVSLVVHVDPPTEPKAYLHRAGRTARAGEPGLVLTLVLPDQRHEVETMTRQAGVRPAVMQVRAGDTALSRLAGAREPSGVSVPDAPVPAPPVRAPRRPAPRRSGPSRRSRH